MYRKRVPDGSLAELSSGVRNQHVAAFSRTEVCPIRDVRSRRADVLEVCWAVDIVYTTQEKTQDRPTVPGTVCVSSTPLKFRK